MLDQLLKSLQIGKKLKICSHWNQHQDFSFPFTVSHNPLITLAKTSIFQQMSGPLGSFKRHNCKAEICQVNPQAPAVHFRVSVPWCIVEQVSDVCFERNSENHDTKHLIWKILSVKGNEHPTIRGCQNLSLTWSFNLHSLCLHNLMPC